MTETLTADVTPTNDRSRWNLINKQVTAVKVFKAFFLFRTHGIEPILIKGFAAAQYYPENKFRDAVDMDLAVADKDYETANFIVNSPEAAGLAIDLHSELRHLDTVEWGDLFENSQFIDLTSEHIRVLRPEDHLRVLCVHWLTDGGSNKDRLWDIYYLVENRPSDFDWDRFLNLVDRNRRRWLTCTIGLAHRFLGLDLKDTPMEEEARELPQWLVKTVEREWSSDIPLRPLRTCLNDRKMLVKQLKKRLLPNPIQATIDLEGSFDAKTRLFYQIVSVFKRARHISRISPPRTLKGK